MGLKTPLLHTSGWGAVTAGATEYNYVVSGGMGWNSTEANRQQLVAVAGTINHCYVDLLTEGPGAGESVVFTLRKNGADTDITVTISGTNQTGSDTANSVEVAQGDLLAWKCVSSNNGSFEDQVRPRISCYFEGSDTTTGILIGGMNDSANNSSNEYNGLHGANQWQSSPAPNQVIPVDGTLSNLCVRIDTAPGVGNHWDFSVYKNGVKQSLTVEVANGDENTTIVDAVNTVDVAPGDYISIECDPDSSPDVFTNCYWGCEWTPDVAGNAIVIGGGDDDHDDTDTEYASCCGNVDWNGSNIRSQQIAPFNFVAKNLYVVLERAPDAGKSFTYTFRDDGDTTLTCQVADAATTNSDTTHEVSVTASSKIDIKVVPSGTPTVGEAWCGFVVMEPINVTVEPSVVTAAYSIQAPTVTGGADVPQVVNAYYISSSTGDDATGDGTIDHPWRTWVNANGGAGLDAEDAISPGTTIFFKRGDTWEGQEALVAIKSSGTSDNWILLDAYGAGDNPALRPGTLETSWTLYSGEVYYSPANYSHDPYFVLEDDSTALRRWKTFGTRYTKDTLERGGMAVDGNRVYVRCTDGANPSTHDMRIPVNSSVSEGAQEYGCVAARKGYNYVKIANLTVRCSYQSAFCANDDHIHFYGCLAEYAENAGFYLFHSIGDSQYGADYCLVENCTARYTCHRSSQAFTSEGNYNWFMDCTSEYNQMAGYDFLGSQAITPNRYSGAIHCTSVQDAQRPKSYDPGFYVDGGRDIKIINCISAESGLRATDGGSHTIGSDDDDGAGSNFTFDQRHNGMSVSTEHVDTNPTGDIEFINCLIYGNSYGSLAISDETKVTVGTITVSNCTIVKGYTSQANYDAYFTISCGNDFSTGLEGVVINNTIIDGCNSTWTRNIQYEFGSNYTGDYNIMHGQGTVPSATLCLADRDNDGSADNTSFAQWQAFTGQDTNSAEYDPAWTDNGGPHGHWYTNATIEAEIGVGTGEVGYQYDFGDSAYRTTGATGLTAFAQTAPPDTTNYLYGADAFTLRLGYSTGVSSTTLVLTNPEVEGGCPFCGTYNYD